MFFAQPESFDLFSASTWGYMLWLNLQLFGGAVAFFMPATFCFAKCKGSKPGWEGGLFASSLFYMIVSFLFLVGAYFAPTADGSTWTPVECKVVETGIAGYTTTRYSGLQGDATYCSPQGFQGYTGITCDVHSQMEARQWVNASLPCASPKRWDDMNFCRYSVWALVAVPGYLGSRERCAYDGFREVTQDWNQNDDSRFDIDSLAEDWHAACVRREQLIGSTLTCWLNQRDEVLSLKNMPAVQDRLQATRKFYLYGSGIGLM
eukprot:TRINITY_DN9255_c0_g1_i1.p1 TRINITY_DN9255_c0_g1~~TRINITY_DN9255_c0_g1_i1.p1  ORF type:complete len:262 (+),score=26.32 TRINITY_DN9255_c0_g1_i1:161-946(+)